MINYVDRKRVCFFDSGIGGLTLLIKCVRMIPDVDFVYFADNYNVPYGNLSNERIVELADKKFSLISKLKPDAAVIACNTVTAVCAKYLRKKYSFPIIGIQPAVKPAAATVTKCAVLATPATASSAEVVSLVKKFGREHTEVVACPNLAAYIEENIENIDESSVKALLPNICADSLVLGCTHYAFIEDIISNYYKIPVFDGLDGTANRLVSVLGKTDHFNCFGRKISFFGGDEDKNFRVFTRYYGQNKP